MSKIVLKKKWRRVTQSRVIWQRLSNFIHWERQTRHLALSLVHNRSQWGSCQVAQGDIHCTVTNKQPSTIPREETARWRRTLLCLISPHHTFPCPKPQILNRWTVSAYELMQTVTRGLNIASLVSKQYCMCRVCEFGRKNCVLDTCFSTLRKVGSINKWILMIVINFPGKHIYIASIWFGTKSVYSTSASKK